MGRILHIIEKKISHHYKSNRGERFKSEEEIADYERQRRRIMQYLEELYVRQGEFSLCETDDCIAYYVQQTNEEKIIIFSSDRDLIQLVNKNISIYSPAHRKEYSSGDMFPYDHEDILIENIKTVKILCGDPSDKIFGIKNLGIKTLVKLIPEIKFQKMSIDDVLEQTNLLFEQDKNTQVIKNILTGVNKLGVFGDEYYVINKQLIDLTEPLLTEEAKQGIKELIYENLDTEGRSYKNTMKMMMEDGIYLVLPKGDDAWIRFLNPFLILTRKEKNKNLKRRKRMII